MSNNVCTRQIDARAVKEAKQGVSICSGTRNRIATCSSRHLLDHYELRSEREQPPTSAVARIRYGGQPTLSVLTCELSNIRPCGLWSF
ncbi:hypothetical protein AVEN_197254-1 [Araneus ventricosus]|uniref:Uncharacterized protein n=1 Tax=Araneus ventricosus TaxID=182803 RepID=A0A4Y2LMN8_ARAVE|nr:hypothetical protein AVEN_197254-1 [Araneus ventricosus]